MPRNNLVVTQVDFVTEDQITPALEHLSEEMTTEILAQSAYRAAERAAEIAKTYAPVRTGNLQRHLEARIGDNDADMVGSASFGIADADVPYAKWQELGTTHAAAQPFLRPTIDNHQDELGKVMADELASRIERAVQIIGSKNVLRRRA